MAEDLKLALVIAVLAGGIPLFAQRSAPAERPDGCVVYGNGSNIQTIVVHLENSVCVVDRSDATDDLHVYGGSYAYWSVCNVCGAPVDVKIAGTDLHNLDELFLTFHPDISASRESVVSNIPTGQKTEFWGKATTNLDYANQGNKYDVSVKLNNEGEGKWRPWDPELQIDTGGLKRPFLPVTLLALLAAFLGVLVGWFLGRRRRTT